MERHYAPRATLYVVTDPAEGAMLLAEARGARKRSGALVRRWELPADVVKRLPEDPEGYARALYAALHELDDSACAVIVAEGVPDTSAWAAVRDRLRRAAHAG
jgi:L-threonylcarbamoyladenylate synthase